jgi:hypothetical protein
MVSAYLPQSHAPDNDCLLLFRVGHEHVGVQGATAFFEGFAQPVTVGQGVIFTEQTGLAVGGMLDNV